MEEIKLNMENLSEDERKQLMFLIEKANKEDQKKGVWKPEVKEEYYTIGCDGHISCYRWNADGVDQPIFELGNCFKTKEEAKFARERQKVIVELKRFAEENNGNFDGMVYYINGSFYGDENHFAISTLGTLCSLGCSIPFFTSSDIAEKAIMKIGEDRLRKYYFGVKK